MTPVQVKNSLAGVRWMSLQQGARITEIIQAHRLKRCLEIGTVHGVGACFMAAAVGEEGSVTTVDIQRRPPDAHECANRCGIPIERIEMIVDPLGSSWVLNEMHNAGREFDFVYIDGRHVMENIICDFFQSMLILRPGGWLAFDDLDWHHNASPDSGDPQREKWLSKYPDSWRTLKHVREVAEKFVKPHRDVTNVFEDTRMLICQKRFS